MIKLASFAAALLVATTSFGAIVTNGSFEANGPHAWPGNGPVANWTGGTGLNPSSGTGFDPGQCCGPAPFGPGAPGVILSPDGGQWAYLQGDVTLSQNVTLAPGQEYTVSYYDSHRNGDGGTGDTLIATIDGITNPTTPSNTVWNARSFNFTATNAATHSLVFSHGNITSDQTVAVDGVAITAVPEPTSLGLLGLAGLPLIRRRR